MTLCISLLLLFSVQCAYFLLILINLYNCIFHCIHYVYCALYCLYSSVCCVLFECGVLFCVMCVISVLCLIVIPLPPNKTPFSVKINNNNN
jgi:hypothetical protein